MSRFNLKSLKPIKVNQNKVLFKNDSVEFFKDPKKVAVALASALLEGDTVAFFEILQGYLSVINKEELSRRSKVPIATIRRMAAGENFNIKNMLKVMSVIRKNKAA